MHTDIKVNINAITYMHNIFERICSWGAWRISLIKNPQDGIQIRLPQVWICLLAIVKFLPNVVQNFWNNWPNSSNNPLLWQVVGQLHMILHTHPHRKKSHGVMSGDVEVVERKSCHDDRTSYPSSKCDASCNRDEKQSYAFMIRNFHSFSFIIVIQGTLIHLKDFNFLF